MKSTANNVEEEDENDLEVDQAYVSKISVRRRLGLESDLNSLLINEDRKPYDRWFQRSEGEYYFNFAMVDTVGLPNYEPPSAGITFVKPGK